MRVSFWGGLALCSALLVCGCGGGKGDLTGTVKYNGEPLKGGNVLFVPADGQSVSTEIQSDGTYKALNVPAGEVTVCVETEFLKPKGGAPAPTYKPPAGAQGPGGYSPSGPSNTADKYVQIPPQYADPSTSPLKITVTGGSQTHDIELK